MPSDLAARASAFFLVAAKRASAFFWAADLAFPASLSTWASAADLASATDLSASLSSEMSSASRAFFLSAIARLLASSASLIFFRTSV